VGQGYCCLEALTAQLRMLAVGCPDLYSLHDFRIESEISRAMSLMKLELIGFAVLLCYQGKSPDDPKLLHITQRFRQEEIVDLDGANGHAGIQIQANTCYRLVH
jgi:hypothetical protein